MDANELRLRVASMNTQLRFGRHQAGLAEAYKLRTFVQLSSNTTEQALKELQRAERVIAGLEKTRTSGIQKLIKAMVKVVKASLNPEKETEETLLDRFEDPSEALEEFKEDCDEEFEEHTEAEEDEEETLTEDSETKKDDTSGYWGEPVDGEQSW